MKVSNNKKNGLFIAMLFAFSIFSNLNAQYMGQGNNMNHNSPPWPGPSCIRTIHIFISPFYNLYVILIN